jgi:hypothetical protein
MDHDTFADCYMDRDCHDLFDTDSVSPAHADENAHRDTNANPHALHYTNGNADTDTFHHGNRNLDTNTRCLFAPHRVTHHNGLYNREPNWLAHSIRWLHSIGNGQPHRRTHSESHGNSYMDTDTHSLPHTDDSTLAVQITVCNLLTQSQPDG